MSLIYAAFSLADNVIEEDTPGTLVQKVYKHDRHVATVTAYTGQGLRWQFHCDEFFEECKAHSAAFR